MSIKLMLLNHPASEIILSWKKKKTSLIYTLSQSSMLHGNEIIIMSIIS